MYPTYSGRCGATIDFTIEDIKLCHVEGSNNEQYLSISLKYYVDNLSSFERRILLCKKNEFFYLFSNFLSLLEEKKLLSKIDFSNLYDYYFTNRFAYTQYPIKATYDSNFGKIDDLYIDISGRKIKIGNRYYTIEYSTQNGKMSIREYSNNDYYRVDIHEYEAKGLYVSDPNFFDNITVAFEDLPEYIQNTLYDNSFNQKDDEKSLKKVFGRLLKK